MAIQEERDDLGLNRAALFIMTLDKPVLATVLKHLSSYELTRLMQGYENLLKTGTPPDDQLIAAAKRFLEAEAINPATHFKDALVLAFGSESA